MDQLSVILTILGKQDKRDLSFIANESAFDLISMSQTTYDKIDFQEQFPSVDKRLMIIMGNLLEFNPYFRACSSKLLKSSVFDHCRNVRMEYEASHKIKMKCDEEDAFDYVIIKQNNMSVYDILQALEEEQQMIKLETIDS